ncbi:MAG: DEAD/DEAH box helicase family protein [Verrucomicrobia bacterium]|nr:DEAD/DEAH box helicase family protein [Verrucomicrobiota bacterium]
MILKHYQEKALEWLRRYYERCRVATAFTSITAEIYGGGLPYSPVAQLPGIPYVCLRIPTGGGKTVVGCEAVAVAQKELLRADHSLVLWLVPSDAIRRQTLDRMKNRKDDYRIALETKLGAVEVLDIEEAMSMTRATLDGATVVVVATMQAFRRKDISQLKVYESNGALMSHFENLPAELLAALERKPEGNFNYSLANVFRLRRPFVIVDEAHNARQPLAFETLKRLNPSGILELTATPNIKRETVTYEGESVENPPSNVLFSVSAYALKAEEMIKLPIYLRYREPWDELLGDAIGLLNELQIEAEKEKAEKAEEGKYLRPVMLLQAQPEYKDRTSITVATVKKALREQFNIPEEEIAVHTGEVRDLDKPENQNVLSPTCKLRFVITVQALKEGWDCPFAYVLFSVAELSSGRAVEQILGRVLRMPCAKRKGREPLNNSYAFVASTKFDTAARALKDGLVEAGFEKQEVEDLVVQPALPLGDGATRTVPAAPVTVDLPAVPVGSIPLSLVDAVTLDNAAKKLTIVRPLTPEQEIELVGVFKDEKTRGAVAEACRRSAGRSAAATTRVLSPSQRGVVFEVPVLALKQGEFFKQFEADDIDDRMAWSLKEANADLTGFAVPTERRGIKIDITDTETLQQDFIPLNDAQQKLLEVSAVWPVGRLVDWIDRSFSHPDLTEAETGIYFTRVVGKLVDDRRFTLEALTAHRHRLSKAFAEKIKTLRQEARRKTMEELLFAEASATVYVTAAATHTFDPSKYPYTLRYSGLSLPRHYYEVIGDLKNDGEEYDCARTIAHLEGVEFWVRNLEGEPESSFWIQTSSDKFYPDFVCKLKNGKVLVVEYKAKDWGDQKDNDEKERLGELWEARSEGKCRFLMIKGPDELSRIQEAVGG